MDAKEIIKRERITLREFRTALINAIEAGIGTAIKRLDEWEMRIEKENLSAPMTQPPPAEEAPIDAAIVAPSLATANGAAASAPGPDAPEGGRS